MHLSPRLRALALLTGALAVAACGSDEVTSPAELSSQLEAADVDGRLGAIEEVLAQPVLQSLDATGAFAVAASRAPGAPVPGLSLARRPAELALALTASAALVPPEALGTTFARLDAGGERSPFGTWQPIDREGAPANGVRFVIDEWTPLDGFTGREAGYADVIDQSTSSQARWQVRIVGTTTGAPVTVMEFTSTIGGTASGLSYQTSGAVTGAARTIAFSSALTAGNVGTEEMDLRLVFEVSDAASGTAIHGDLGLLGYPATQQSTLRYTLGGTELRVQFRAGDGDESPTTLYVNGTHFATGALEDGTLVFRHPDGTLVDARHLAALTRLIAVPSRLLVVFVAPLVVTTWVGEVSSLYESSAGAL